MDLTERKLDSTTHFEGKIFRITVDHVTLPNGKTATREIAHHCGAVAVLPITKEGNVILVTQYRYALGKELLEIPAGKMDLEGEAPLESAIRELREETGCTAGQMISLGDFAGSPGCMTEIVHLYLALDLEQGESCPDEDEFLRTSQMPLTQLIDRIMAGEVTDGKTIAAALKAEHYLKTHQK